jgi:hypothetical protein
MSFNISFLNFGKDVPKFKKEIAPQIIFIVGTILETACRLKVSGAKIQKGNYTISDKYKAPNHVYCTISDKYKAPNHVYWSCCIGNLSSFRIQK